MLSSFGTAKLPREAISIERIQLNEDTVWLGEKRDRSKPDAQKALREIRRLLNERHPAEAQRLADRA
jgi:alpha-L-fucosidase 2